MSTPVEIASEVYAAFGRGDVPAILERVTDDVDWTFHGSVGTPYGGTYSGKAELQRWFGLVAESDQILEFQPREMLAGADHVTVLGWERTKALPNGATFESGWVHVFIVRDGKVSRFVGTLDTAARMAAAR